MVILKEWITILGMILNVLLYLVSIGLWITIPDELKLNLVVTLVALALTTAGLIFNRKKFKFFYTSKFFAHLFSNMLAVFLIFIILGLLNFLAYKNPIYWDISKYKEASLTSQSRQVLKGLTRPVRLIALAPKRHFMQIKTLLELYRVESSLIELQFIDAELRPDKVKEYGVSKIPKIILESGNRRKQASELNELSVTNALINITRKHDPLIFYSIGHEEMDLADRQNDGGSELKEIMANSGIDFKLVDLRQKVQLDEKPDLIVIWGARSGFRKEELQILREYLAKGGQIAGGA